MVAHSGRTIKPGLGPKTGLVQSVEVTLGPASYVQAGASTGWEVEFGDVEKIIPTGVEIIGGGEWTAQIYSYTGNKVKIKVRAGLGEAAPSYASANERQVEVAGAVDLSGLTFILSGVGK